MNVFEPTNNIRGYKTSGTSVIYDLIVTSSLCLLKKRFSTDA